MIIPVKMKERDYDIVLERGCINNISSLINVDRKVLIITDSLIPITYVNTVKKNIKDVFVYTVKSGEQSKNFKNFENIIDFMIENNFSRTDCVIALGGGVVGDMAGFISSVYMRGIDFYNIPTSLLSQVDSSIGGKTAIDKLGIKNVVGAFYPPKKVIIDPNVLLTLDERQLHNGLVEAFKMALTCDKSLVNLILESKNLMDDIDEIIYKALLIKKSVVEEDPNELGIRKVLNFGHTIGHAIEASYELNELLHGECVGLGMLYMASESVRDVIYMFLKKYNLPYEIEIDKDVIYKYICLDKKRSNNFISIVRVEEIGNYIIEKILLEDIKKYF